MIIFIYILRIVKKMGRHIRTQITVDQINNIIVLTKKGYFRRRIADETGVSKITVWKYQRQFDLI